MRIVRTGSTNRIIGSNARLGAEMPMGPVLLSLPWPPSENHYRRYVPGLRNPIISRDGRAYLSTVAKIVAVERKGGAFMAGEVEMWEAFYPPDRRRRDLDNLQKALWDSLKHAGIIGDDSQIGKYHVERMDVVTGGRVDLKITLREG